MRDARLTTKLRTLATCSLLAAICTACAAPLHAATPPDAVIELWEQHWTLNEDGSTVYYNKQHMRLNNDRTYRQFADPRITYNVDADELEIINARVKRADGSYCEQPDYAHVKVSPNTSAGWPAFANIRDHIVVMSGIEPGCLVELEYKITSRPGAKPFLSADVRLDHQYPVREHRILVNTPLNVPVHFGGILPELADLPATLEDFVIRDLPAMANEPQSPPWQARCARLAFSTADRTDTWLRTSLHRIDTAADDSELIARLTKEWTKDQLEPSEKLRAIQKQLAGSFNFVEFDPAWRPADPRPASETLRSSYGLPEEAAALLLSLARAAGLPVRLGILSHDDVWVDGAPQRSFVAAYVVLLDPDDEPEIWDAHRGRIVRDSHWAGYTLRTLGADGKAATMALPAWTDADQSRCRVRGKVTLKADGTFAGNLSLRTTGLFVSPESLRSNVDQKRRVGALLGRVLPDVKIESFTVEKLSAGEFAVEAKVKSGKALKKTAGAYWLQLASDGPFRADVSVPLNHSERSNAVRLAGAFDEHIELTIEWPKGWNVEALPGDLERVGGDWGEVLQSVALDENSLVLTRHTRVAQRELAAEDFLELRGPLNELRNDAARTLLLRP